MLTKIVVAIFLLVSGLLAQTPTGYKTWDLPTPGKKAIRIGGMVANYLPTGSSNWSEIENDWQTTDGLLYTNRRALLKTDVNDAGQSIVSLTMDGNTYTVSQRLLKVVWINTATQNWTDIADVSWPTPTVDSNIIHWQGVIPGIDYRVRKLPGQVQHGIFFKPGFLDSAVALYDQRSDSSDIALGNVMAYTLVGVDHADSALGTIDRRRLKQIGKYLFSLNRQTVHFPGSDTLPPVPVKQRWIKQGGKIYCVEYVMMSAIKRIHEALPGATIWHNDNILVEDDEFQMTATAKYENTDNFGSATTIIISNSERPADVKVGQLLPDLSAIPAGSNIDSVRFTLTAFWAGYSGVDWEMYQIVTEWNEAVPMSYDSAGVGLDWATGSWSTSDITGSADVAAARAAETDDGLWESGDGSPLAEAVQNTLDGTAYGFALYRESGVTQSDEWRTEDHATASSHPEMYVEFTPEVGGECDFTETYADTVAATADDAGYWRVAGGVCGWGNARTTLLFGNAYSAPNNCPIEGGIRWQAVAVDNGAVICSAILSVNPTSTTSEVVPTIWHGEDTASATEMTSYDLDVRLLTDASVTWDPDPWTSGVRDELDVTTLVQEVVNRGDWETGNDLMLIYADNGAATGAAHVRFFSSYDGSTILAPNLTIEYEVTISGITRRRKIILRAGG